jgi:DNA-binding NarL/FixJ family response regulator
MTNSISLGICDEVRITREGICALLKDADDMEFIIKADNSEALIDELKATPVNILLIVVHSFNYSISNLLVQISTGFPRIRMLIVSASNDEVSVLKSIKAGAKGFLAKDTTREELIEAIYTLRNGYDFFSNSVTMLLLNKYIKKLKTDDDRPDIRSLSTREIEIMKMWGNSFTNKEIADKLFLSVRTVETHKNHIMQKLNMKTSVDLVKFAIRNNIIDL